MAQLGPDRVRVVGIVNIRGELYRRPHIHSLLSRDRRGWLQKLRRPLSTPDVDPSYVSVLEQMFGPLSWSFSRRHTARMFGEGSTQLSLDHTETSSIRRRDDNRSTLMAWAGGCRLRLSLSAVQEHQMDRIGIIGSAVVGQTLARGFKSKGPVCSFRAHERSIGKRTQQVVTGV